MPAEETAGLKNTSGSAFSWSSAQHHLATHISARGVKQKSKVKGANVRAEIQHSKDFTEQLLIAQL